jgi:hypothetical protein
VWGLGFRVSLGLRVYGFLWGLGFRVKVSLGVLGLRIRFWGSRFSGLGPLFGLGCRVLLTVYGYEISFSG